MTDQLVAETSTWQHSRQTNIHAIGGIRTHDLSRRAAADPRLRPCGHWDRQPFRLKDKIQCDPVRNSKSDYPDMHLKRHLCVIILPIYTKRLRKWTTQFCDLLDLRRWKFEASKMSEQRRERSCARHRKCWSNNDILAQGQQRALFSFALLSSAKLLKPHP